VTSPLQSFHASNLLTYLSLLAAMGAMGATLEGATGIVGGSLALAVIADTFDGAFARRFNRDERQRACGAQIDSLSDAIAFGIAPVVCAALLLMWRTNFGPTFLIAGFAYAACAITRLAHFNLHHEDGAGFVGLPVPVAALIWATALLFSPSLTTHTIVFGVCAGLMVAPLPIPRPSGVGLIVFALWPLGVAAAHFAA
jgi:phosphatidylserine synthase